MYSSTGNQRHSENFSGSISLASCFVVQKNIGTISPSFTPGTSPIKSRISNSVMPTSSRTSLFNVSPIISP